MTYTTLLELAQRSGTNGVPTIVDGVGEFAPELKLIPSVTIKGTVRRLNLRTGLPRLRFRYANGGIPTSKAKYKTGIVEAYNLDSIIAVDVQVADDPEGSGRAEVMREAVLAHGEGGLQSLGWQNIYGTKFDEKGFPGLIQQMDDFQTISANPAYTDEWLQTPANLKTAQADNKGTSAILLCLGNKYAYQFWGNGKVMSFGTQREEIVQAADGGMMNAVVRPMNAKAGLALVNPTACARIKNISAENPLTDDLLAKAEQCLPNGAKYIIMCSRTAYHSLQMWRRANGRIQIDSGSGEAVAVGRNMTYLGMQIISTTSIFDDETDAYIKAKAAENEIKRQPVRGTM